MANRFSLLRTAEDSISTPKAHCQDWVPHYGFRRSDLAPVGHLCRQWKTNQKKSMIHPLPARSLPAKDSSPVFLQTSCPTPNTPLGASSLAPCTTNSNFSSTCTSCLWL